ncbi:MAG: ribonuclease III [Varibaculum sp.]|nr:ribonuclease III [Varibaculum sp.]
MNEDAALAEGVADADELLKRWGVPLSEDFLILALTHRSFANEAGGIPTNERLEFFGDAVLELIVSERLYRDYPDSPEGDLTKMRTATVSEPALAHVARNIGLGEFILLGHGEDLSGGRDKDSILSDTVEALIGATYLSYGLERTREVVETLFKELFENVVARGAAMDWKTNLAELARDLSMGEPTYTVTGSGPDHQRVFHAVAVIDGVEFGGGDGKSKKVAEHRAAQAAAERLARDNAVAVPFGFNIGVF